MIYVFKTISYPVFIKVGYSANSPDRRLKSVQTGCPYKVEIHLVKEARSPVESMLHSHLKEFRACGEWFIFSPECEAKLNEFFGIMPLKSVRKESLEIRRQRKLVSPNSKITAKVKEMYERGMKVREIAKELNLHKATVIRHRYQYHARENKNLPNTV